MNRILWSEQALRDIDGIYRYIAQDSPANADAFLERLMDSVEKQLGVSPAIGREIPEMKDSSLREILYGSYRVMYHVDGNTATITHVRHGARQFGME